MYSFVYVGIGIIGFALLLIFDLLSLRNKNYLKYVFGLTGFLMIFICSLLIIINYSDFNELNNMFRIISSVFALASLSLLVYSVFIEVGKKTYQVENKHILVTEGTYALTRHPGVLWMLLLFIFGAIMFQNILLFYTGLIWTIVNIIYVSIQERYIFHKIFDNYEQYQKNTPMILPNIRSIGKFTNRKNWRRT